MLCPKCGASLPDDAMMCPNCGAELRDRERLVDTYTARSIFDDVGNKLLNFSALFVYIGVVTCCLVGGSVALKVLSLQSILKGLAIAVFGSALVILLSMIGYAIGGIFNWTVRPRNRR